MQTLKLFSVMLIGFICLSFSSLEASEHTPKIEANGDTVIIKFGENSRLELHIANDEDRKTLSNLDLNALVDKVNAYMNEQKTPEEPIYSEANPMENRELISNVSIATVYPTENPVEPKKQECDGNGKFKMVWSFDVGFNNYQQNGRVAGAIAQDLNGWNSNYFAGSANIKTEIAENTDLRVGVEVSWNSLQFQDNTILETNESGTTFLLDTFAVEKSKLNISYLSVPVMFEFKNEKKWAFGVGGHLGYKIGSHFKRNYRTEGINKTEKKYDSFGLSDFKYGLRSEFGYDGFRLFMNYDLNPLFTGKSPDLQLVSFGLRM